MTNKLLLLLSLTLFLLPLNVTAQSPIDNEANTKVQVHLSREAVRSYLNGTCVPKALPAGDLPVILLRDLTSLSNKEFQIHVTATFSLALGIVPHQHSIPDDIPIPEGWHHLTHYPETRFRLIGRNTPLVTFCKQ